MKIAFARGLLECYQHYEDGKRRWGESVARKFIQRVNTIKAARDLQSLRSVRALRLHQLKGAYEGQFSIELHDRWRLLFTYDNATKVVLMEQVTNHYGD